MPRDLELFLEGLWVILYPLEIISIFTIIVTSLVDKELAHIKGCIRST